MEKEYNLSKLFEEEEFDVQKGYRRYGTREAFFTVLHRFMLDSEVLLQKCKPELYESGESDMATIARAIERLQGILANIGAINLAWRIQYLNDLLQKKHFNEYSRKYLEILPDIEKLRMRITSAEKTDGAPPQAFGAAQTIDGPEMKARNKKHTKLRIMDFEKLLMLIDNFEFESADNAAKHIMSYSYSSEIDQTLSEICRSLHEFNHSKSLDTATKLLEFVRSKQSSDKAIKKNILAIDDMPDVLRTVKTMLKDKYNVFGMTNYESAIKFLRSNTADLILLDIEMPGLDGFAMLQLFRNIPEYTNTPIIFLTGNASDEHIKMAANLGAHDFIKKPVNLAVLIGKLEDALSQNQREVE